MGQEQQPIRSILFSLALPQGSVRVSSRGGYLTLFCCFGNTWKCSDLGGRNMFPPGVDILLFSSALFGNTGKCSAVKRSMDPPGWISYSLCFLFLLAILALIWEKYVSCWGGYLTFYILLVFVQPVLKSK